MSPVISADVPDELAERVDEEREGKGDEQESRSQAVKRLLRAGLEHQEQPDGFHITKPGAAALVGAALWFAAFGDVHVSQSLGLLGGVGAVLIAAYTVAKDRTPLFST